MKVDIWSDIACPWCFIGKRRLERALAQLDDGDRPTIRWRAYQLMPELAADATMPARAYLERKLGGAGRLARALDHVGQLAKEEGIAFDIDRQIVSNTARAHRAVALARACGREDAAVEAFFRAQFEEGADLSRLEVVAEIGARACAGVDGADPAALAQRLAAGEGADAVRADLDDAAELGITGVPFFVLNGRLAVSGAQDAETFLAFLAEGRRAA